MSILVRACLQQNALDLSEFCSEKEEYAGVTIRHGLQETTIVSAYVAPQGKWNPNVLYDIQRRAKGEIILVGDFSAHSTAWGDGRTNTRGSRLEDTIAALDLITLNSGAPTFVHPGVRKSVLDLAFASPKVKVTWTIEPDTWGSDHVPIIIAPPKSTPVESRTCTVVNWDLYRKLMIDACSGSCTTDITAIISECLRRATRYVKIPVTRPVPDLEFLNLRAARRQAQRRAIHTDEDWDWNRYRKIDAAFRRHTKKLQRQ